MSREARKLSRTGIYHVMLRGINRQNIFEDDEDRLFFMRTLKNCRNIVDFKLYAFALMTNHVHFLIGTGEKPLEEIFRRVCIRYAGWYNRKYERIGHLFQDRFRSEVVETNLYFMTVLRYIMQNPMKAGMEEKPGSYRWSSFPAYERGTGLLTDTQYALELFGSKENLIAYLTQKNEDSVMDEDDFDRRLREEAVREKMIRITHCDSVPAFQLLDFSTQKRYINELYQSGLSLGQISRYTGMSKPSVHRAVTEWREQHQPEDDGVLLREDDGIVYESWGIVW